MKEGQWVIESPLEMAEAFGKPQTFSSLEEVFDLQNRDGSKYEVYLKDALNKLVVEQKRKFGALVMEPVILGAGGMLFA
jgi:dethiobiotin synthetase/adenosylmethionine--8-amino-7-oxononanoate aminotransferase